MFVLFQISAMEKTMTPEPLTFMPCVQEMVGTLCCVRFRDKRLKRVFVLLPVTKFRALEG